MNMSAKSYNPEVEACSTQQHPGVKYDDAKLNWSLLPWKEVEDAVEVLQFGATKYSPDNWKRVPNRLDRYFSAMMRHTTAWVNGERNDQETGKSHLAHALCCLLFLMWSDKNREVSDEDKKKS